MQIIAKLMFAKHSRFILKRSSSLKFGVRIRCKIITEAVNFSFLSSENLRREIVTSLYK